MKIVIVGGGTAGWMAAAYLGKYKGYSNITVVESPNIPHTSVGESVTPHLISLFEKLNIDNKDWMLKTGAIYKLANKFVGWDNTRSKTEYFSFNYTTPASRFAKDITPATTSSDFSTTGTKSIDYVIHHCLGKNFERFDKFFNPHFHYMEKNVAPFYNNELTLNGPYSLSFHVNAEMVSKYLREEIAKPLGVNHISATVANINHTNDIIHSIELDTGQHVDGDFFIDCTGIHKLLVGKLNWPEKFYHNNLIDRAWVCQSEYQDPESEMVNYTQSIAEPYGWRFKIGLYHRIGNGYCYSSKHLSDEDALEYFESKVPNKRTKPILFKWNPKRLEYFGKGNLAAVGLSCGFVEPLEANALFMITANIRKILYVIDNQFDFKKFNDQLAYAFDDIADFILVHYTLSSRNDTSFWREMQDLGKKLNHKMLLNEKYTNIKNSMQSTDPAGWSMFPDYMWGQLAVSWETDAIVPNNINHVLKELSDIYYKYSETKHNIISNNVPNNFQWLKENIFEQLTPEDWAKKYLK